MCAVLCLDRLAVVSFQVKVPLALSYKLSEICTNPIRIRESLESERAAPTEVLEFHRSGPAPSLDGVFCD